MSRLAKVLLPLFSIAVVGCGSAPQDAGESIVVELVDKEKRVAGHFGYGETATSEQVAGWNIDIRPDGLGLPPGGATAEDGEMLYEDLCASCHGSFGEGVGRYPVLAGGEGTLTESRPEKTVGSFWPYASTLWDYIHRAMPFAEPESLSDEEVYAMTAYVLYLNDLIEYDFAVTQANLASIEMPNRDGFFLDDRPDIAAIRCMDNCKDPATIKITSEADSVDGEIVAEPVATAVVVLPGKATYDSACAVCHAAGVGEAPIPGEASAWADRLVNGRDALVASAIEGKGIMPPKGGQMQLSDEDVANAVDFILSVGQSHD